MLRTSIIIALTLAAVVLAGCNDDGGGSSPTNTPPTGEVFTPTEAASPGTPTQGTPVAGTTPQAEAQAAIAAVEADFGNGLENFDPAAFVVTGVREQEWPDGCLGAPQADESCASVVTPGWEIVFEYADAAYTYRTNTDGTIVRFAGLDIRPGADPS